VGEKKLLSLILPVGFIGGLAVVALGSAFESEFIRGLGAFLLLFCIFTFPAIFQRSSESLGE